MICHQNSTPGLADCKLHGRIFLNFSVTKATLQSQISICLSIHLSVTETPQPIRIKPICHHLHLPSIIHHAYCISVITPIRPPPPKPLKIMNICHHAYQPSCSSAFMPISHVPISHLISIRDF